MPANELTPTDQQQAAIAATKNSSDSILLEAYAGCAKALASSQRVLTPWGYHAIGDLVPGEKVIGRDGEPHTILGVFDQGVKPLFKFKFSDRTEIIATEDHLWKVMRADKKWFIKTTKELMQQTRGKTGPASDWGDGSRAYWFMPMLEKEVNFKGRVELPIEPWLLGILLGDGYLAEHATLFSSNDQFIIDRVREIVSRDFDLKVTKTSIKGYDYRISSREGATGISGKTGINNALTLALQILGLSGTKSDNKFVPNEYRTAHWEDRLALLQGLMDSDGTTRGTNSSFTTTSFALADDVKFLVESLGGTATRGISKSPGKVATRLYIKLPENLNPFSLPRKALQIKKGQRKPYRAIVSITPCGEGEATCIAVDAEDHLFLAEGFIPTHNTTTLVMMAKEIKIPALALAFNVSIKKELAGRFPPNFSVQTMNGLGYASLIRAMPSVTFTVDAHGKKLGKIIRDTLKDFKIDLAAEQYEGVRDIVRQCMIQGLVPKEFAQARPLLADTEANWLALMENAGVGEDDYAMVQELCKEVLIRDIEAALKGFVSFDDQIYVSTLIAGRFPQFPAVLGDEIQDFSPLNHAMLTKSVRPDGRLLMVGDKRQSIYAFRGADTNSIAKIKSLRSRWIELPLTTTFRCPKVVVQRQLSHAPGFQAGPLNKPGLFVRLPINPGLLPDTEEPAKWNWGNVEAVTPRGAEIAVLCRNNAPILKLAFKLLAKRKSIKILGREIGRGIIALTRQLAPRDATPKLELAGLVAAWEDRERALAIANDQGEKVEMIQDKAECVRAVLSYEEVNDAGDCRRELNFLFSKEEGAITLSSIHKAKGLEWDVVLLLDPWRMPSKWAREQAKLGNDVELQQEMNLKYVAETRTKEVLIHASVEDFE